MTAFEKYYHKAQLTTYGEPEKVAELLCEKIRWLIEDNIHPSGKKQVYGFYSGSTKNEDMTDTFFLEMCHRQYINGVLRTIRHGEEDYVFNPEWLFEIYEYEPAMKFTWEDGVFVVWKEAGE